MARAADNNHQQTPPAGLTFDPQEFMHFLNDCDWTEEQKAEFISELWKIVVGFVDLGVGIHPIQQVTEEVALVTESGAMLDSIGISNEQQHENTLARQSGAPAEAGIHGKY